MSIIDRKRTGEKCISDLRGGCESEETYEILRHSSNRNLTFQNSITAQVVQLLPNGNLMVQGKKTLVNANERIDLLVSGIVDPRFINEQGYIDSSNVANLQFALNGKGSTSRLNNEGIVNRVIRYLF